MTETRVQINQIINGQLPSFVREEFPLVSEFLSQYYQSLEYQSGPSDILQNIDQYVKVDTLANLVESTTLSSDIDFGTDTISVTSTYGFPDAYGLLLIDNEIITYTSKTSTTFQGCIRGFSGTTAYQGQNGPDQLVFTESQSSSHSLDTTVSNLSILFLKEFFNKVKKQITPGFESRELYSKLNQSLFVKQAKDFYSSKGTDYSFKILFRALYGVDVEVIKPRDYLFEPSNAQYSISKNIVVKQLSGNPTNLENKTLYQESSFGIAAAQATVSKVEKIQRGNSEYYILSLDYDSISDVKVSGSTLGEFAIHPITTLVYTATSTSSTLEVDSTVGFPSSGEVVIDLAEGNSVTIAYKSKTLNQFLECTGIDQTIKKGLRARLNVFAYAYSDNSGSNLITVRVTGVLSDLNIDDKNYYYEPNDLIQVKSLGKSLEDIKSNNWFFNIPTRYDVKKIDLLDESDYTYRISLYDSHTFNIGNSIIIYSSNNQEFYGNIIEESIDLTSTSNIISYQNITSFNIKGQGYLDPQYFYTVEKNVLKVNCANYPSLNQYTADVQNVYEDLDDHQTLYVTSPSLPNYSNLPINIEDRSVLFSGTFDGIDLQIPNHGFYSGDSIVYNPTDDNKLDLLKGIYFIKKIDVNTIRIARSRDNILAENYVYVKGNVVNNKFYIFDFTDLNLNPKDIQPQKLVKKLSDPAENGIDTKTSAGPIGILINGVELISYKSTDSIYYGEIENITPTSQGNGYDIINPPILTISDNTGYDATAYCSVIGNFERIDILDPGFDYIDEPIISITGGNGIGAVAKANLINFDHSIEFNANASALQVNLTNDTIGFSSYHKFRTAEKVIYSTQAQTAIGGLYDSAYYFVNILDGFTISLHKTFDDASVGINTINLTSYGVGNHVFSSTAAKKKIGSISVINSGLNYQNKKLTTTTSGINTSSNSIFIKNHRLSNGEIVNYDYIGSSVVGLATTSSYYVTKISDDEFKLSGFAGGNFSKDYYYQTNQYVDLISTGSGTHIFNYPKIEVTIKGNIGVSTLSGQDFNAILNPIFRGSINSVHVKNGGFNYGSQEILNNNRQPLFTLSNGSGAQVSAIISNGKIEEIYVVNGGSGYNCVPDLIITGDGSGARLIPIIENGFLVNVTVVSKGNGYSSSSTKVDVITSGSGAYFEAKIKYWNVNLIERLIQSNYINEDDGIVSLPLNERYGLEYTHAYAPRKLRSSVLATKYQNGIAIFVPDLLTSGGVEAISDSHSPIIGWAYDGNPIYGPYGFTNPQGGTVRLMKSGYELSLDTNRPSQTLFAAGFFVDDYKFKNSGDLDEHNGRFCVTPEYPKGIYAYFLTIDPGDPQSSGPFRSYKKPVFPYVIGDLYKSNPIEFNFSKKSNQDDININEKNWIRNSSPYKLTADRSYYDYLTDPNKIKKQFATIQSTSKGTINSIGIITGGNGYQVNDAIIFDNTGTNGQGLIANVSKIFGQQVSSIACTSSILNNVEFVPLESGSGFIGFSTIPHNFSNNDLVTVTSLFDYQKSANIKITNNQLTLVSGVGSAVHTGLVTYFKVQGDLSYPSIRENDIYHINNEQIKILNIDSVSSRVRVIRNQNGTSGLTTSSAGIAITELPRKLLLNFGITTSYQYNLNTEIYFDPTESVGIGTTAGVGIGYTISFTNPGAGLPQINIPTKSIYLPKHGFKTGTQLTYSVYGNVPIGISTDGISNSFLADQSIVYAVKLTDNLLGISTVKVGLGSTGNYVGIGSTTAVAGLLYFTNSGTGNVHSFKPNYSNILNSNVSKNVVTVSTSSSHGLSTGDNISLSVKSGISTTFIVKYDDYNRRLVIDPKDFLAVGVDTNRATIKISNHKFKTGQKAIHTSNQPCGGLSNESIYYIVVVDNDTIQLTDSYYSATKESPNVIGISSESYGSISLVNPLLEITKNQTVIFDLSDSSLSFIKNSVQYSAFEFDFYTDNLFQNIFNATGLKNSFEVIKNGKVGIDVNANVVLYVNDFFPTNLYYKLTPVNSTINLSVKTEIIVDNEVLTSNQLVFNNSQYSGKYPINVIGSDSFNYNILNIAEKSNYSLTENEISYSTNSPTAYGRISNISILSKGRNYKKLPSVSNIISKFGKDAILTTNSNNIGSINKIKIEDIGFEYSCDFSVRPSPKLPDIIKIKPLSSFKRIGISSVGIGYNIAPNLIVIDPTTSKVISDIDLKYNLGDSEVKILKNTKEISNVAPIFIPINNVNGVGISTIKFINSSQDVVVTLGASFSNLSDFPFEIGDRVLIESISVGINSDGKGYNSENYNYALFTIINRDPNIGGIGATVSYRLASYLSGSVPGSYDPINSYGRIIPEKYFPKFDAEFKINEFFIGETVLSPSANGFVQNWDSVNGYLKVSTNKDFKSGENIVAQSSRSQAIILDVINFDSIYDVKASSIVTNGWQKETGFLNNNLQRIHDNDYYQYFSYALKSEIPLDTWNTAVSDLNHASGFKKFSNLIIEKSEVGIGTSITLYSGISTNQDNGNISVVSDCTNTVNINAYSDFDLVAENNLYLDNTIKSNQLLFNSKPLQDYLESIGNRVLRIDDISNEFKSTPRSTTFSTVDTFNISLVGYKKYFVLITDKIYTYEKQGLLLSLLHDGTYGYLNQYASTHLNNDLGSFDFSISGSEANLLFYPTSSEINNYDVTLSSYDIYNSISGISSVSLGNIVNIGISTSTVSSGSTSTTSIVGIASTYRASKILVELSASDNSVYFANELTVLHDGTNANLLEYGELFTNSIDPYAASGLGTFGVNLSGSNLNINFTPYYGLPFDLSTKAYAISIGSSLSNTGGSQSIVDSVLSSSITSIASSTAPISNIVTSYSALELSAYYIAVVEDVSNNSYQVSELMSISDGTNTGLTEFGIIQTLNSLGSFTIDVSGTDTNLYFTPIANIDVVVRVFQHALNNQHDLAFSKTIDLNNGKVSSAFGSYEGTSSDVKRSFNLTYNQRPIFERYFYGNDSSIINLTDKNILLDQNFFVTGEEIEYSYTGAGTSNAIGIATTSIPGIGSTDKLPKNLYIVKDNELKVQVSASASEALKSIPTVLTLTSVGIGTSHVFRSKNNNSKVLLSIDNLIQTPIVSTSLTTTLSKEILLSETLITVSGITSFFGGDLIKIDNEIMKISTVGFGSTNILLVNRPFMGTGIATHTVGSLVSKVNGTYNIVNNVLNFSDAPLGKVPFINPSTRSDEKDYIGIETSSTFNGRAFLKSATPDSNNQPYYRNYIFDDISYNFTGVTNKFILKSNLNDVSGIATQNGIIIMNNIFQLPSRTTVVDIPGNYKITEASGISTITFVGSSSTIQSNDINTPALPRGGIIVSVGSTKGFGYQSLVAAGATAIVSASGTISSIVIGNLGSGYRSGIQTNIRVSVATSSLGTPNITFVGVASVGIASTTRGRIVSIAITNPGAGYTSSNPPIVTIDSPFSYTNLPLIYSNDSRSGLGTVGKVNIVVGQGSSVISFELSNTGYGYGQGEILTIQTDGMSGIPLTYPPSNFKEFQISIDKTFTDNFSGWSIGDLQVFDLIESLFDGTKNIFPLLIDGYQTTLRSRKGSAIDIEAALLVFINDILQVPGKAYNFTGGSVVKFQEPPKLGDTCKILFYQGNRDIDVRIADILETIKSGDNLQVYSEIYNLQQNSRIVTLMQATDSVLTNLYTSPGVSDNSLLLRPVNWQKQSEDLFIDNKAITKDRIWYESLIQPSTNIIQNVGLTSNTIFVESVKTFFDSFAEYQLSETAPKKITILSQDTLVAAAATAIVSVAGTISSILIGDGGVGYSTNPSVTIASAVGFGSTTRASAISTINITGIVTQISMVNPGSGYTTTNPPTVLIEVPSKKIETIANVNYEGDFGIITGIASTSVGVASTGLIFNFFIPQNSFLRNTNINSVGIATTGVSGIQTGYYFVIKNSNVGNGVVSLYQGGSVLGIGSTFIDNIYEVAAVSVAQTSVSGVGLTYVAKVTVSLSSYNGLAGIGSTGFYGEYSWGRITNLTRTNPKTFNIYNNGPSGISTSPSVTRYNPLKYRNYYT